MYFTEMEGMYVKKTAKFLCLVMSIGLLAGCGGADNGAPAGTPDSDNSTKENQVQNPEETDKPEKITIISTTDDVILFEHVGEQFKEKYGVSVEIVSQAYDNTHQKIATSFSGKTDADLIYVDVPWAAEFASLGITIDLDSYMTEEYKDQFIDAALSQLVCDGRTQAIPFANNGKWMFYNKKLLAEGGYTEAPKTWEELKAMSQDLIDKGIVKYGIAWAGKQAEGLICDMTTMLYSFGGSWKDDQGNMAFNSPEGVASLQFMVDSLKEGWADPSSLAYGDREVLDPFMAGDIAFVMNWSFAWGLANSPEESQIAGDVDIALMPGCETTRSAAVTGGGGLGIISTSDAPDYAWKYIELLTSEENQIFALDNNGTLPTVKSLYQNEELLQKYEYLGLMYPQYEYSQFRPQIAQYSQWSNLLQGKISEVLAGEADAQEAMDAVAADSAQFVN